MINQGEKFAQPSRTTDETGKERKVGFEFEYAGLDNRSAAALIVQLFGGKVEEKNRFDMKVVGTKLGDFEIALDARLIKNERYLSVLKSLGIETGDPEKKSWWEDLVEDVATLAVPYEIGCPPIPISELPHLEKLREGMLRHEAIGTKGRLHYAFGMHLNPQVPDVKVETILGVLKSFLIHYPWLLEKLEVDLARRVAPFINPFPDDYVKLVLQPGYKPDKEQFSNDYLKDNPTRNRPLDLLPILCLWDEEKIRKAMPEEKVKARPTFHYRMPNCLFDDPDWRLSRDWNYWVKVEDLAWDKEKLDVLSAQMLAKIAESPLRWSSQWGKKFGECNQ